ncbi:unnamed protein product [Strongylus vulgaris]|uniref:Uncharacterized protein n=1 Tax=Strongylus vulgaris TaxID=40348 RepID=A0A3P7JF83_STRVU|nr:unnamed protein product [Strongylus vulgaris]
MLSKKDEYCLDIVSLETLDLLMGTISSRPLEIHQLGRKCPITDGTRRCEL